MATETVTPTCLTGAQVEVVQKLYGGPVDAEGRALYPGHEAVGSELAWGQFVLGPAGMTPMAALIANGYLKYLAFPTSPPASFSYKDWEFTLEGFDKLRPMGEVYNATNPDLSAFAWRGRQADPLSRLGRPCHPAARHNCVLPGAPGHDRRVGGDAGICPPLHGAGYVSL